MSILPTRALYHMPGACSRVALNALEEIGLPYQEKSVGLHVGAQYAPEYLAINPKGKVPLLVEDGRSITELPVILRHLALAHPAAQLLPSDEAALSDLIWIAGALHPIASRLFRPGGTTTSDPAGVKAMAMTQLLGHAASVEARLNDRPYWYGDDWSITDMFLGWVFALAAQYAFPLNDFQALAKLRVRVEARPSFVRARALELAVAKRDNLPMPPGFAL